MQPKAKDDSSNARVVVHKSFRRAVALPPAGSWRVKDDQVAARGYVLCITKSKGLLFDKMTNLEPRLLTLTRSGLLIIYNKEDKGYIVDVKEAKVMTTKTDFFRTKRATYRRCTLKLKFKRGSVSLILFNEEIPYWRPVIATAHDGVFESRLRFVGVHRKPVVTVHRLERTLKKLEDNDDSIEEHLSTSKSPDAEDSGASITTCVNAEGVITPAAESNSEVTVDMPDENEPVTVIEARRSNSAAAVKKPTVPSLIITTQDDTYETFDPTVCDSSYQWLHNETKKDRESQRAARQSLSESSNSGLFTETTDDKSRIESAKSVRCGYTSVATLRSRLEAKINGRKRRKTPKFPRNHIVIPSQDTSGETHVQVEEFPPACNETNEVHSPIMKARPVVRSYSESEVDAELARRRLALDGASMTLDDSLLGPQLPEHIAQPANRPTNGDHNELHAEGKYASNQWWAQPLRV